MQKRKYNESLCHTLWLFLFLKQVIEMLLNVIRLIIHKLMQEQYQHTPQNPSRVLLGLWWDFIASCSPQITLCPPGDCRPQKTTPILEISKVSYYHYDSINVQIIIKVWTNNIEHIQYRKERRMKSRVKRIQIRITKHTTTVAPAPRSICI